MAWKGSRKEFINKYGAYIHKITRGTGILPGTLITQLFVESSANGVVGGSGLTQKSNNYFGIKCAGGWKGPTVTARTREETASGKSYYVNACFRKYESIEESIKDYIKFLKDNQRYQNAGFFEAKTVLDQFKALKRAGYATADSYVSFLNSIYTPYALLIDEKNIKTAGFNLKSIAGVLLLAIGATILTNKLKK
jgi:flagellum-specific peptidoglycan hydrolase FlgJ